MANFDIANIAVKMLCPNNEVKTDDTGQPSVLVYIPKFKLSDVLNGGDDSTHPAFIVNGKEIDGFYYSKYQNVVYNGVAYSLPGERPFVSSSSDNALKACEAKGAGWHLSTAAEWAAIALWCKKNGFLPYGNNNYGKDSRESNYKAVPATYDKNGKVNLVKTGTGPLTWSHDGTLAGIWDMNGNCHELQAGLRVVWGEVQILANNDAADTSHSQSATSAMWKAINAADGTLVEPESKTTDTSVKTSGNTVKLDYVNNVWTYSTSITVTISDEIKMAFDKVTCDGTIGEGAKQLLRALALLPEEGATSADYEGDSVGLRNNISETLVARSGSTTGSSNCGIFFFSNNHTRAAGTKSFRASFIPDDVFYDRDEDFDF